MKNTKQFLFICVGVVAGLAAGCGKDYPAPANVVNTDSSPVANHPTNAGGEAASMNSLSFAETINTYSRGLVKPAPWAGYWFPYTAGGTWFAVNKYDQVYLGSLTRAGRTTENYQSAAAWEAWNHSAGVPKIEPWFGHCNGWSASALMVPEPRQSKTVDGMEFDVSEQKALLAESWLEFSGDFVGTRVNEKGDIGSEAYWDIVPAQFHLMLVNLVGKQGKGLILDRHTGHEIWNQPLVAYSFDPVRPDDYLGPHPSFPNIYRVNVSARLWWANDNVPSDAITPPFNLAELYDDFFNNLYYQGRHLFYELWLDAPIVFDSYGKIVSSGNILVTREDSQYVGGAWKNAAAGLPLEHAHPDYFWVPFGRQASSGYKNARLDDLWVQKNIASEVRE